MKFHSNAPDPSGHLSTNYRGDVISLFKDIVTAMSVANSGNRAWWYTWLASRDRFNADLLRRLSALASNEGGEAEIQISGSVFFKRVRGNIVLIKRLIGEALWFARWWYAENKKLTPIDADVIIVSQLSKASFKDGEYKDIYFGKVPNFLSEHGEKVVVCGSIQGEPLSVIGARNKAHIGKAQTVTSFGAFLRLADFVPALWRAIFNGIRCIDMPLPWGGNSRKLLDDDIRNAVPHIFHGLMIERAAARLLQHFPSARLIHMYENNPWEHAVNWQASRAGRETIGFLHCAVLPSHMKNYIAEEELKLRPSPDRIVCTGSTARDVFLSLGAHDPRHVIPGCDLRGARPTAREARMQTRGRVRSVLAILEGLPNMVRFLKFLDTAAQSIPDVEFLVREHPALPLSSLIDKAEISLHPDGQLIENKEPELLDAMEAADVVIYQGTTVAMTAVYLGIPIIKFQSDEPLQDDPLFQSSHLKRMVRTLDDLQTALDDFSNLDQDAYLQEKEAARDYVERYLESPTSENMRVFLNNRTTNKGQVLN